ncbi:hypothetical protein ST37_08175 [Vibrio sp. qd031]|uniref:hypothetical protein n=1 Tax=Vibrio sp. qd031 TaxID=1603038 RepID=UPI000A102518|nr:hypothetical protein [Vibrio sp. qd031]ORT50690.1 hypothetical protein ST37_08175 [Vibrio sp. qd031]
MQLLDEEWKGWSEWYRLTEVDLRAIPTDVAGTYIIACNESLSRAHGADDQGVLDIGESGNLRGRIRAFKRCATGESKKGHMAGWRYFSLGYHEIHPFESLWVCYRICDDKDAAYREEGRLLRAYVEQHYELPPLNYKFNWSQSESKKEAV